MFIWMKWHWDQLQFYLIWWALWTQACQAPTSLNQSTWECPRKANHSSATFSINTEGMVQPSQLPSAVLPLFTLWYLKSHPLCFFFPGNSMGGIARPHLGGAARVRENKYLNWSLSKPRECKGKPSLVWQLQTGQTKTCVDTDVQAIVSSLFPII